MKYYKIIQDGTFIGVVTSNDFVRYQVKHGVFITSNERRGEFVEYKNKLYRGTWMPPSVYTEGAFELADIIEITKEVYDQFYEAIEYNQDIEDAYDDGTVLPPPIDPMEQVSIEYLRENKIAEMSYECRTTIENGFDLIVQGGTHHFSLTTQDQLNLMSLSALAQTQSLIPYHADGEECTFYTSDEINSIMQVATELKIYNTTYYNALKEYINALDSIEEISAITYGTEIPDEYKSDVLKILEA